MVKPVFTSIDATKLLHDAKNSHPYRNQDTFLNIKGTPRWHLFNLQLSYVSLLKEALPSLTYQLSK